MDAMRNNDSEEDIDEGDNRNPYADTEQGYGEDYDQDTDEEEKEAQELKECTFKPNINKSNVPARTVDDLIEWGKLKHHRMLETKIKTNFFNPNEFNPSLNQKSKRLAGGRRGKIEDRLLKLGQDRSNNLKKKREEATLGLFVPIIGDKSKEIATKKKQDEEEELLRKHMIAQHGRADYFQTVPGKSIERLNHEDSPLKNSGKKPKVDPM